MKDRSWQGDCYGVECQPNCSLPRHTFVFPCPVEKAGKAQTSLECGGGVVGDRRKESLMGMQWQCLGGMIFGGFIAWPPTSQN